VKFNNKKIFLINGILNLIFSPLRFLLNLYLASLLTPGDYGLMVIPIIIISISEFLIDSGFRTSLIQKSSLNSKHSSTIFIFNFIFSLLIFFILILISSNLLNIHIFKNIQFYIYTSATILLIKSFSMIPEARMQIKSQFTSLLYFEFASYLFAYILVIIYSKYYDTRYSLILLFLFSSLFYTLFVFLKEKFIPKISDFSNKLILFHWRTGKKILFQGFLELLTDKVDELTMTNFLNNSNLGIYSKGKELSNTIGVVGSKFFSRPWFSLMSKFSNDRDYFRNKFLLATYLLLIAINSLLILSNLFGVFFITYFLGNKWVSLISFYKYLTLFSAMYILFVFNKYTISALGYFKHNLKIEKYFVLIKFLFLFLVISFLYFNNLNFMTIIIAFIIIEIFSKFLIILLQIKYISKWLIINPSKLFSNILLILLLFCFFIFTNKYLFLAASFLFIFNFTIKSYTFYRIRNVKTIN
jgi:teichuronic acid exporter